jgi:predicted DNA-binding ribbon-helix-helix protein
MSYMTTKSVTRSIRIDADFDDQLEALAAKRGMTVSAFIRATVAEVAERDARHRRLAAALTIASDLPDVSAEGRAEMWDLGTRVPR